MRSAAWLIAAALLSGCGQTVVPQSTGSGDGGAGEGAGGHGGSGGSGSGGSGGGGSGGSGAAAMPELLAEAAFPNHLRHNAKSLFFHESGPPTPRIVRVDKDGGGAVVVAETSLTDMAVTDTHVYFSEVEPGCLECPPGEAWLRAVSVDGGPVTTLATFQQMAPLRIAVVEAGLLFTDASSLGIHLLPFAGGPPQVVVDGQAWPNELSLAGTRAFFTYDDAIRSVDWTNPTVELVATTPGPARWLLPRDGFLYWETGSTPATIHRADLAGAAPEAVVGDVKLSGFFDVDEAAYLTEIGTYDGQDYVDGRVVRAPLDGGPREVLAEKLYRPGEILIDGAYLYWLSDGNLQELGSLMRLERGAPP